MRIPEWGRLAATAVALSILSGCMPETDNTIIADPIDLRAYEGFWVSGKAATGQLIAIAASEDGRSARVKFVSIDRATQEVSSTALKVEATRIGDATYFEAANAESGSDGKERFFGRFYLGTAETPNDTDKMTVCVAESETVQPPIEQGKLKGTATRDQSSLFATTKIRITASTEELRAFLAATPLQCRLFNTVIYVRAREHVPTAR